MSRWIGFQRAVNVGRRAYPMAQLRAALIEAGYREVATHIQTGNFRVETRRRSRESVRAHLEQVFATDRGFTVPTLLYSPAELSQVVDDADRLGEQHEGSHYVCLVGAEIAETVSRALAGLSRPGETVVAAGRSIHLFYDVSFHEAKVGLPQLEKVIGTGTVRNRRVIDAIASKWGA